MSSKRRLRRKSCTGKRKYNSKVEAEDSRFSLIRRGKVDGYLDSYKCKFCDGYHLGRSNKRHIKSLKNTTRIRK